MRTRTHTRLSVQHIVPHVNASTQPLKRQTKTARGFTTDTRSTEANKRGHILITTRRIVNTNPKEVAGGREAHLPHIPLTAPSHNSLPLAFTRIYLIWRNPAEEPHCCSREEEQVRHYLCALLWWRREARSGDTERRRGGARLTQPPPAEGGEREALSSAPPSSSSSLSSQQPRGLYFTLHDM